MSGPVLFEVPHVLLLKRTTDRPEVVLESGIVAARFAASTLLGLKTIRFKAKFFMTVLSFRELCKQ